MTFNVLPRTLLINQITKRLIIDTIAPESQTPLKKGMLSLAPSSKDVSFVERPRP
jgi:hypothetical protein